MGSDNRQPAARLGDIDTGHPPYPPTPVITGSTNVFINSRPAARQGDVLAPHHPGVRLITEGSASVLINGRPAARVTDAVNCGGKIVTGSSNVQIGNQPAAIRNPKVRAELSEYVRESLKPENISLTRLERAQLAADIAVKYRGREGAVATWHDYFMGNRPEPGDMGDPLRRAGLERAVSEKAIVTCPSPRDDAESTTADLGDDVNKILAKSPSLQRDLEKLKARGWTITRGPAGEGTYVRETGSLSEIVIDSGENGNEVIQSLAHEVGHAIYSPPVVVERGICKNLLG